MLPVTSHKSFHIPHSLATAAAIAALITALGWETSGDDSTRIETSPIAATRAEAGMTPPQRTQHESATEDATARTGRGKCAGGCDRDSFSELLPLALPSLSGH